MLDQAAKTPDTQEDVPGSVLEMDEAQAWEAVLAASPAMGRLPDMIANQYDEESHPDIKELEEFRQEVRDRMKTGIIFAYEMLQNNLNKLFEHFDIALGGGIDILVDDIEATYERDEGSVESYSSEEVCGRLFAYIAIESYCRHRAKEVGDDGSGLDMQTGWYKDLEPLPILIILESVIACVKMAPEFQADVRREATKVIYFQQFLLLEPDKNTRWH